MLAMSIPPSVMNIAAVKLVSASLMMTTGTQISAGPSSGTNERKAPSSPQKIAACTPNMRKMMASRNPCNNAMSPEVMSVALVMFLNSFMSFFEFLVLNGISLMVSFSSFFSSSMKRK